MISVASTACCATSRESTTGCLGWCGPSRSTTSSGICGDAFAAAARSSSNTGSDRRVDVEVVDDVGSAAVLGQVGDALLGQDVHVDVGVAGALARVARQDDRCRITPDL